MNIIPFDEFVTGEKLQSLADFCIIDKINPYRYYFSKEHYTVENKNEPPPKKILNYISNIKSLYFPTHLIKYFFDHIYKYINNCVIITHNSGFGIPNPHFGYINIKIINALNSKKIKYWYSPNVSFNHLKLKPLPLGINNSMYKERGFGDKILLYSIMKKNIPKTILYYFNFTIETNKQVRQPIYDICVKNKLIPNEKTNQKEYWINLKKSKFCISPPGSGFDCHRMWECIYLNTIPIVSDIEAYKSFKDLPILFMKDWNLLTEKYMNEKYEEMKNIKYNYDKIKFSYYKKLLNL